jgi:hypothetical protein
MYMTGKAVVRNGLLAGALLASILLLVSLVSRVTTERNADPDPVPERNQIESQATVSDPRSAPAVAGGASNPVGSSSELVDVIHPVDMSALDDSILQEFIDENRGYVDGFRVVTVDGDSIRAYLRDPNVAPEPRIELLEGYAVRIEPLQSEEHYEGWQAGLASWSGRIVGDEAGGLTLTVGFDNSINAIVTSSRGRFEIRPIAKPYHVIWRMSAPIATHAID